MRPQRRDERSRDQQRVCVVEGLDPQWLGGYLFDNVTTITRDTGGPEPLSAACLTDGQYPSDWDDVRSPGRRWNVLGTVLYTTKGEQAINAVAPGVFFYYGTITGRG